MSTTDELLDNARGFVATFDGGGLGAQPGKQVAVVTCMDTRINPYALLGLAEGDAHLIRNAGGAVTPDVIRSLTISQRKLGTREIIVIQHTLCGMCTFTDDEFRAELEAETAMKPDWAVETFTDLDANVRQSLARITSSPFVPKPASVRGFVYDVVTGTLNEVGHQGEQTV